MKVLTVVSADVDQDRADDLVAAYDALLRGPRPDGLLETRLLGDGKGHWAIHTVWRDSDALDAMRASGEPPAAPKMFAEFGAEPQLTIMQILGGDPAPV